jgi:hypothetical protein
MKTRADEQQNSRCPRCGGEFHCGVRDDKPCACGEFTLTTDTLAALRHKYGTCLCFDCLARLQAPAPPG